MKHLINAIKADIDARYAVTAEDFTAKEGERKPRALHLLGRKWNAKPYRGTPAQVEAKIRRGIERCKAAALARELAKIEAAEAWEAENGGDARLPNPIIIRVDWTRNRTWGHTARARDNYGNVSDIASGCGYCKGSTATAGVLNQHLGVLLRLYRAKDAALAKDAAISNRAALPYGAGYGVVPYFEGGVGVSCHVEILRKLGFSVTWAQDVLAISEGGASI